LDILIELRTKYKKSVDINSASSSSSSSSSAPSNSSDTVNVNNTNTNTNTNNNNENFIEEQKIKILMILNEILQLKSTDEEKKDNNNNNNNNPWNVLNKNLMEVKEMVKNVCDKIVNSSELNSNVGTGNSSSSSSPNNNVKKEKTKEKKKPWEMRANVIKAEIGEAASLKKRLEDADNVSQERLRTIHVQDNELKEFRRQLKVFEIQVANLHQKEMELKEEMEKQIAKYVSQEKMYEEALEASSKDNEQLDAKNRQHVAKVFKLEEDIKKMENEYKNAKVPSIEVIVAEIKSLKDVNKYLMHENLKVEQRNQQIAIQQLFDWGNFNENNNNNNNKINNNNNDNDELKRKYVELVKRINEFKTSNCVIDISGDNEVSPRNQLNEKVWRFAQLKKQVEQLRMEMKQKLIQRHPLGAVEADFKTFPSVEVNKMMDQKKTEKIVGENKGNKK